MHRSRFRPLPALLILLLPLAAALGCSRSVTGPANSAPAPVFGQELDPSALVIGEDIGPPAHQDPPFYPLAIGDRWTYDRNFVSQLGLGRDPLAESTIHAVVTRQLECSIPVGSDAYVSEHTLEHESDADYDSWILYRQDQGGLFEADYVFTHGAPCVPAATAGGARATPASLSPSHAPDFLGRVWSAAPDSRSPRVNPNALAEWNRQQRVMRAAIEGVENVARSAPSAEAVVPEIQRLRYPLRGGTRWIIRAEPQFISRVTNHQQIRTPAGKVDAYKIKITSDLFGARDYVTVWYGKVGFIGIISHAEGYFVDESGNFAGWLTSDYREILTGYDLQEPVAAR